MNKTPANTTKVRVQDVLPGDVVAEMDPREPSGFVFHTLVSVEPMGSVKLLSFEDGRAFRCGSATKLNVVR